MMSGVSSPAGIDVKPLGVISPLDYQIDKENGSGRIEENLSSERY